MKKLHPTQQKLIDLLKRNMDDPMTIREIQEDLNISSTSVVAHHINQLEKKGYLKRNPDNPKDYQVLSDSPEKLITYLNLYGLAHCGSKGSILDGDPTDRIPIASQLVTFPVKDAYMVQAKGDSMEPRVHEGDFVIVQKTNLANSGNVVVCVNKGEAIIKRMKQEDGDVILISENSKYSPFIAAKDFRIEGVVKGVITRKL
jgi:repressor LexA